jgi:hypothetical protein
MDSPPVARRPRIRLRSPSHRTPTQGYLPWYESPDSGTSDRTTQDTSEGVSHGGEVDTEMPETDRGDGGNDRSPSAPSLTRYETAAVHLAAANPAMPASEVSRQVGLSPQSTVARRLGTNGDLRAHVRALLAARGFDDKAIISKWADLATAKKTEFFSYQGQVLDQREVDALDIQVKGIDALTKLARLYPVTDEEAAAKGQGPPALLIQLNLGTTAPGASAPGVSIDLGSLTVDGGNDATDTPGDAG